MPRHSTTHTKFAEKNALSLAKDNNKKIEASKFYNHEINLSYVVMAVAVYSVATANISFFEQVLHVYPFGTNTAFLFSLTGLLFGLIWLILQLLCYRSTTKAVLIMILIIAAVCGYFTNAYGTIFDRDMLVNSLQTDQAEAMGLMSTSFVLRLVLWGVLPAVIISKLRLKKLSWRQASTQKASTLVLSIALIAICLVPFGDQYASFFRQHKQVRYYANPITPIYSVIKLGTDYIDELCRPDTLILHATDAK